MAYRANPFLERMSERTTSDQEFVQLFAPKILEKLNEDCFEGAVHVFHSPPGGGKTTILRAFTPNALRAFWHARHVQADTYRQLVDRGVIDDHLGPQVLSVLLSCAAGYADLPPGASAVNEGLFRALLDCRIVLRTLRSVADLIGGPAQTVLQSLRLEYEATLEGLTSIPAKETAVEMLSWAETRERQIYSQLDNISPAPDAKSPTDVRFESLLWLQAVRFVYEGKTVAPKRLLMIDDIHRLRKTQRTLLIDEIVTLRPTIPVWLAGRSIAFADDFLSQGVREGRDIREYALEDLWGAGRNSQFVLFAQNILDRRFKLQQAVPGNSFNQYLAENLTPKELESAYQEARKKFRADTQSLRKNIRYSEWMSAVETTPDVLDLNALVDLYTTRILIERDRSSRQLSLQLTPLSTEELEDRDSSSTRGAAEIFLNYELKVPYYFGTERVCTMATNNVEELLALAAALYDGMKAKQILRRQADPHLLPGEQEKRVREVATRRLEFIPRSHSEGTRAQRLLEAIGTFCKERTFQLNAPYAPGVTGVRLSTSEIAKLQRVSKPAQSVFSSLKRVLAECAAENLLVTRESSASTSRESGKVFYLNRTLCAHFGLPLQYGGWQDVSVQALGEWMESGLQPSRALGLEVSQ
ncbi:hypothetical protein I6F35_31140 [Bradyrhizobium sp. BRP22]|uniref:ORC-CDC6 family AAA ATPase n=1 Tax=Bradyrhizobium sp. BRP22 TaxID=2793821 RepID=UPI001CD50C46|nr:hypothetical protein [Bradyrhizobium sp. BRP22]MCA1457599.1 hypothetical protein [Bradyrhizobium sp. BRP22]